MTCVPAPAAKAVLAQASARWPNRSRASDGICPSAAHTSTNPTSDHERGLAVDLTHDPTHGCDAHAWAEDLRLARDPRVKYLISNRRIAARYAINGYPAWAWRPYAGPNPHEKHCHVSLRDGARNDTSPWFDITPQEEDDMAFTDKDSAHLEAAKNYLVDQQRQHERIIELLEAIDRKIGA